ncbi:hypothetical protein ACE3L8_12160 [Staphylococcus simulans]|uniref:hypothetical protein n=1 Tax=Staphylococcus simulans TaxID=1286 RepID=UPI003661E1F6
MFLLEFKQFSTRKMVGLFKTEDDVKSWISSIENIKIYKEKIDGRVITDYFLEYMEIPSYSEINWKGSKFILSKYMFSPEEGDISITWEALNIVDEIEGIISGQSKVGAYVINNGELEDYIKSLEDMKNYLIRYFENKNHNVEVLGHGSEDGEYILVDDKFLCHLEGDTVTKWQEKKSPKSFLDNFNYNDIIS